MRPFSAYCLKSAPIFFCILSATVIAGNAVAQQFVEETSTRLPNPPHLEYSEQLDLADVDSDGDLDIMIGNGRDFFGASLEEQNRLYINDGTGHFADESLARLPAGMLGYTRDVEFGDIDNDGDLDLFVANYFSTQSWIWLNDGNGFFTDATATHLPVALLSISDVDFGDVDNDGDLDVILADNGSIVPGSGFGTALDFLYLNDGAGHFTDASATHLPGIATGQAIDFDFFDMDGDFDLDLVNGHRFNRTQVWENDGTGHFANVSMPPVDSVDQTYSVDAGDIDGDGDLDIIVTSGVEEAVYANDGTGQFTDVTKTALPINSTFTDDNDGDFIDVDNDGDLDFVIAFLGPGTERFYVNDGNGVLTQTDGFLGGSFDATLDVEFGDVNNDGRPDLITAQGEVLTFLNRLFINTGPQDTRPPTFPNIEQHADTKDTVGPYVIRVAIRDVTIHDNNFHATETTLHYSVDGAPARTTSLTWSGGDIYRAEIPGQPTGSIIQYHVTATDHAGNQGTSESLTFIVGTVLFDSDGDGDVDLADFGNFQLCFTGPGGGPLTPTCQVFDSDGDDDVDLTDFSAFQLSFTGPM
jgi:hypothetical protein